MQYKFMRFPGGKSKAITLSYDDGCTADLKLLEIIDKYGLKATLNLNSALIPDAKNDDWHISYAKWQEILKNSPHEIAVHGALHKAPGLCSPVAVIEDILSCRKTLEEKLGRIIRGMAYPDSGVTRFAPASAPYEELRGYLKGLGIKYSRSLGADNDRFDLPADWYNWLPTAHHTNPELFAYLDKFLKLNPNEGYCSAHTPKLFYLWGHSFEFANNKNWDLLEKFCAEAKSSADEKGDIWFATNGEIYDYTKAYESLEWNAEETLAYNPALTDIYLEYNGEIACIRSGETKNFKN